MTKIRDEAVARRVRDLLLHALTVSSGAVDTISFLALGKVFSVFMTGNIVFLGLQVAGANAPGTVVIVVAMAAFAVGVYLSTLIVKPSEGCGVWRQRVPVALGAALIPHTVFLTVWFVSNGKPSLDVAPALLGLWGFAMGMQSGAVRTFHVEGCVYDRCDRDRHMAYGLSHQLVPNSGRVVAACRRPRLFVRRCALGSIPLGTRAHLCFSPSIRDQRRGCRDS